MTKARDLADLNFASPELTGTPIAPTATAGTNTTQIATTAFVGTGIANLVDSSPDALNTLNELAAALGDDANFSTTVTNNIATKAPLADPTFTGTATVPTLNSTTAIQMGGTEVLNSSRQLSNIASIDVTTATAISAAGVGGGGTAEFTTSANVTAGDPVVLNSNGTVKPVTTTASFSGGTLYNITGNAVYDTKDMYYNPDFGITVMFWKNEASGNYVYGSYIDGATSFAAANSTIASWNFGIDVKFTAYDPVEKTFVAIYGKSGTWYYRAGQLNSNGQGGISWQSETSLPFNIGYGDFAYSCYDPDSGKIIMVFRDSNNSDYIYYAVATVSGTSVSFGSKALVYSGVIPTGSYSEPAALVYDETANRVLFCWRDQFTANATRAIAGSVSGTTVTWGSSIQVDGTANYALSLVYDPISGKNLLVYGDGSHTYGRVLTLSGSTVSTGSETIIANGLDAKSSSVYYNEATQQINVLTSNDSNSARVYAGTISGTAWSSAGLNSSFFTSRAQNMDSVYNTNFARGMVFITNASSSDKADMIFFDTATSDASGFVGVAAETITSGAAGDITVLGGVNENQSGLTVNDRLYVSIGGGLTKANTGTSVGRAISSTKILITGGQ